MKTATRLVQVESAAKMARGQRATKQVTKKEPTTSQPTDKVAAVFVAIADLHPWAKNPRRNDASVNSVVASISKFGFGAPIVARLNGEIISGHTRYRAALKLGMAEVPVRYLDISEAQAHALALADNKIGELSEWDYGILSGVLVDLNGTNAELLKDIGFTDAEMMRLLSADTSLFLDEFINSPEAEPEAAPVFEQDGFVTFGVKLLPEQHRTLQKALLAAKRKGARSNVGALLALCEAYCVEKDGV